MAMKEGNRLQTIEKKGRIAWGATGDKSSHQGPIGLGEHGIIVVVNLLTP
jgi:hypothetical protein